MKQNLYDGMHCRSNLLSPSRRSCRRALPSLTRSSRRAAKETGALKKIVGSLLVGLMSSLSLTAQTVDTQTAETGLPVPYSSLPAGARIKMSRDLAQLIEDVTQEAFANAAAHSRHATTTPTGFTATQSPAPPPSPGTGTNGNYVPGPYTGPPGLKMPQSVIEDFEGLITVAGFIIFYWVANTILRNLQDRHPADPIQIDPTQPPISVPPWTNPPSGGPLPAVKGLNSPMGHLPINLNDATLATNISAYGWPDRIGGIGTWTNELQCTVQSTSALSSAPFTNVLKFTWWLSSSGGVCMLVKNGNGIPIMTNYSHMNHNGGSVLSTPFNITPAPQEFYRGQRKPN